MRYDAEHKARTRQKVVRVASEAIRADGPQGVGVADIMARAGLTHGGFYAHFKSKDDLVVAALDGAFADTGARFARSHEGAEGPRDVLRNYVRFYLSRSHRDGRSGGCPLPALSSDMARLPEAAKGRFGEGVQSLTDKLAGLMGEAGLPEPAKLASSVLAELMGALSLARAVGEAEQSDAILFNSRRAVLGRLGLDDEKAAS